MLLFIDACLRKDASRTWALCQCFLEDYRKTNPDEEIITVDLGSEVYNPMNMDEIRQRDTLIEKEQWDHPMFAAAKLFAGADRILIGAPFWDDSFPAVLKCYIEHICVNGIAMRYTEHGPEGLCRADRMLYITTAGGNIEGNGAGFEYLRELFTSMLGLKECRCVKAEMLDVFGQDVDGILAEAKEKVRQMTGFLLR